MKELRDIKEIVEVSDSSLLLFVLTVIVAVLLISILVYFLTAKRRKRRAKPTPEALAKAALRKIDYTNAKEAAYCFSENAYRFVTDENRELYQKIDKALMPYKYKKEVPALDTPTAADIKQFISEMQ